MINFVDRYHDIATSINREPRLFLDRLADYIRREYGPMGAMDENKEEIKAILSPVVGNWAMVKDFVPDDGCMLPLVAKYAAFAYIDHPSDEIVDDIYEEAVRVAKMSEKKFPHECDIDVRTIKDPDTAAHRMSAFKLCKVARHPAQSRLEKIVAVETVINARHTNGPFFEHICVSTPAASALVDVVLDILAG